MAQHVLIEGVGHDIEYGNTLIEGVRHRIEYGKTLIEGVGKDILMSQPSPYRVSRYTENPYPSRQIDYQFTDITGGKRMSIRTDYPSYDNDRRSIIRYNIENLNPGDAVHAILSSIPASGYGGVYSIVTAHFLDANPYMDTTPKVDYEFNYVTPSSGYLLFSLWACTPWDAGYNSCDIKNLTINGIPIYLP